MLKVPQPTACGFAKSALRAWQWFLCKVPTLTFTILQYLLHFFLVIFEWPDGAIAMGVKPIVWPLAWLVRNSCRNRNGCETHCLGRWPWLRNPKKMRRIWQWVLYPLSYLNFLSLLPDFNTYEVVTLIALPVELELNSEGAASCGLRAYGIWP